MLKIENIAVDRRLHPFSAVVSSGQQIHLIGPNGSGKSTLLARIAGMLAGEGEIRLEDQAISSLHGAALAQLRGYLQQQHQPGVLMTVFQYLSLYQPAQASAEQLEQTVILLASRLKIEDKLTRSLTALSGGEWQRVRLAAILLQVWPTVNPHSCLLLLDEPMTGLDIGQQAALSELLNELCQAGRIVILSGHDLNHTLQHASQVWLLDRGAVISQGLPEQIIRSPQVAKVFGVELQFYSLATRNLVLVKEK